MAVSPQRPLSVVTGGCGFIGRHLAGALADRGDRVLALDITGDPWRDDVVVQHVDLRDADAVRAALEGADAVFHNASLVHTRNNRVKDVWAVNLGGTENVLAGCAAHAVPKLVYVSSASVVYEGRDIENGDEGLPYAGVSQAPYADSKIAAERLVLAHDSLSLATCAIRPHVVFGPGDVRLLPAILDRARAGKLKYAVGRPGYLSDFTYISNLTEALLAAEARLAPGSQVAGEAYFITNAEPIGFFEFVAQVLAALDLPALRGRVPFFLAYGVAAVAEAWDTLRGGTLNHEDGLSRFAVRYLCTHHYFDVAKARAHLGYVPRVDIATGIARTVAHLRATGAA
jgi:sterol-4alpha-carboxylate 3-dehydrogenase (decarboxylating)